MIDNAADVIDSRQIIERITQLQAIREPGPVPDGVLDDDYDTPQDDLFHELAGLEALAAEATDYSPDWQYGVTLVRDSYFIEYARELAEEVGAIIGAPSWPYTCVDWDRAANELRQNYTSVEFDGVTYWTR